MESLTSASSTSSLLSLRSQFSKPRAPSVGLTHWVKPKSKPKLEVRCVLEAMNNASAAAENDKEVKLWGGRFEESVTDAVERFTESISFDKELYKQDIMGSRAHASMLAKQVFLFLLFCFLGVCLFPEKMSCGNEELWFLEWVTLCESQSRGFLFWFWFFFVFGFGKNILQSPWKCVQL